jgi:20S proteasome alpha/beta subunit
MQTPIPARIPFKPFTIPKPKQRLRLTTIVVAKCPEGIVVACDSQGTIDAEKTKNLAVNKIILISDGSLKPTMILAASGSEDDIALLKEAITNAVKTRQFDKDSEVRGEMDRILRELFKRHNVERSHELGLKGVVDLYNPDAILAVKFRKPDKTGQLFGLYHLRYDGLTVPVERYQCLGSGGLFARFLLDGNERMLPVIDPEYKGMPLPAMILSLMIVINQVKFTDLYSGGPTRLAIVSKDGAVELDNKDMIALQQTVITAAEEKLGNGSDMEKAMFRMFKAQIGGSF